MNVFILSTGRCGSTTFARACGHITNFTAAHESRIGRIGPDRLEYPDNHIESDNRLIWFAGRLERRYGDGARYVHLRRDDERTAASYSRRMERGLIMYAYGRGIYQGLPPRLENIRMDIARDYVRTVNANIEDYLADKTHRMEFRIENAREDFQRFWEFIGAEGDLQAALAEFETAYNSGAAFAARKEAQHRHDGRLSVRIWRKAVRLLRKFPHFLREA